MKTSKKLVSTAYHEAGHAAAHIILEIPFKKVTIIPEENSLGHVSFIWRKKSVKKFDDYGILSPYDEIYFKKQMISDLAGGVAERKYLKRKRFGVGSSGDWHRLR